MPILKSLITLTTINLFITLAFTSTAAMAQEVPEETTETPEEPLPEPPIAEPAETETQQAPPAEDEEPIAKVAPDAQESPEVEVEDQSTKVKKEDQTEMSAGLTTEEILLLLIPDEVDAKEGFPPPAGWEEVVKPRSGLIAGGTTMFLCSYIKMITVAGLSGEGVLAIPVVGTLFVMDELEELIPLFIFDVAAQTAGLIMAIAGGSSKKKKWVRIKPDKVSLNIAPTVLGKKSAGIGLSGTF